VDSRAVLQSAVDAKAVPEARTLVDAKASRGAGLRRDERARKTGVVGVVVQILSHCIRLAVIPLSLHILGQEQYGLWLVVGSLVAWGGIADLGFSPGLINVVASAQGRGDRDGMGRAVSTAFVVYGVLAVVLAALTALLSQWEGLPSILGVSGPDLVERTQPLVGVVGLIFSVSVLTRVVGTVTAALQEGYLDSYSHLAGNVVGLVLLVVLWASNERDLLLYALAVGTPTAMCQLTLAVYVFRWKHRDLRPSPSRFDYATLRTLWSYAGPLAVYQVAGFMVLYSANLIIANRLGPSSVTEYSVPYAAFAVLISAAWILASPYMPAIAEAQASGDWVWLRRRVLTLAGVSIAIVASGGTALLTVGQPLIQWWTADVVRPSFALLGSLFVLAFFRTTSNTGNVVLVGLGKVKLAAWAYLACAGLYIVAAWSLAPRYGINVVALSSGLALMIYSVVLFMAVRSTISNHAGRSEG
jgi:O-antigen/teichoic acid export membrane protein